MAQYRRRPAGPRGPKTKQNQGNNQPKDKNFSETVRAMFKFVQMLHHLCIMTTQSEGSLTKGFQIKERELRRFIKPACPNPSLSQKLEQEARGWVLGTTEVLISHYRERSEHFRNLVAKSRLASADFDRARQIATGWAQKNFGRKLKDATLKALNDICQAQEVPNTGTPAGDQPQPSTSMAVSSEKRKSKAPNQRPNPSSEAQVSIKTPPTVSREKRKKPTSPQSDEEVSPSTIAPPNKIGKKQSEFSVPITNKFAALSDLAFMGKSTIGTPTTATPSKRKRSDVSVSPDSRVSPVNKTSRQTQSVTASPELSMQPPQPALTSPELLSQLSQSSNMTASPCACDPNEEGSHAQTENMESPDISSGQPCQLETRHTPIKGSTSPPQMQPLVEDSDESSIAALGSKADKTKATERPQSPVQVSKSPIMSNKNFRPMVVAGICKGNWKLPTITTKNVILGDSNLRGITKCRVKNADQVLQVCSYPGAKFHNMLVNVMAPATRSPCPDVSNVVLSLGINERENNVQSTSLPCFRKLMNATRKAFPNANIYVPTLQWDKDIIEGGESVHNNLTALWKGMLTVIQTSENTFVLPPLEDDMFMIQDMRGAGIHWTSETANSLLDSWVHHLN